MLNIATHANGQLFNEEIKPLKVLPNFQPIWVNLESPTMTKKRWIKQFYIQSIAQDVIDEAVEDPAHSFAGKNGDVHVRSDTLVAGVYGMSLKCPIWKCQLGWPTPIPPTWCLTARWLQRCTSVTD